MPLRDRSALQQAVEDLALAQRQLAAIGVILSALACTLADEMAAQPCEASRLAPEVEEESGLSAYPSSRAKPRRQNRHRGRQRLPKP